MTCGLLTQIFEHDGKVRGKSRVAPLSGHGVYGVVSGDWLRINKVTLTETTTVLASKCWDD